MTEREKALLEEEQKAFLEGANEVSEVEADEENTLILSSGEELRFDFNLTGKDILKTKDTYQRERKKKAHLLAELDDYYFLLLAEKTARKSIDQLLELPVKDYNKVVNFVRDFLGDN